ncbi:MULTISPECIES: outer membrane protein [Bradyrhizobium]|uniref:outer membrane protein n=1 Tax=Bradyrhizobium TaxID=374 RepID=UPI001EDB3AE0|nr:outer membrane beta-barrel protein [Bradyrhizobium zhengyangense]MCG2643601.1 outer membrane beta-barrel protein [Bradyrhizobium zhengyangense]
MPRGLGAVSGQLQPRLVRDSPWSRRLGCSSARASVRDRRSRLLTSRRERACLGYQLGTKAGWTVGAGGEFAIDRNWSVKVEYLYMDLGSFNGGSTTATTVTNALSTPAIGFNTVTTTTTTGNFGTRFTYNIVRIRVNYRFSGPVVARY